MSMFQRRADPPQPSAIPREKLVRQIKAFLQRDETESDSLANAELLLRATIRHDDMEDAE